MWKTIVLVVALLVAAPARGVAAPDEGAVSSCRKLPPGKRLKLNLKPNTELGDLIAWIAAITCKQFVLPGTIASSKTVTIIAPQPLTSAEAYQLFLQALDSVGLTVYQSGRFLRVIETAKAKTSPIPILIDVDLGRDADEGG
jgi:type II secretory pathway component GspD/PulD (secretin)